MLVITEKAPAMGFNYGVYGRQRQGALPQRHFGQFRGTVEPSRWIKVSIRIGEQGANGTGRLTANGRTGTWRDDGKGADAGRWEASGADLARAGMTGAERGSMSASARDRAPIGAAPTATIWRQPARLGLDLRDVAVGVIHDALEQRPSSWWAFHPAPETQGNPDASPSSKKRSIERIFTW